MRRLCQVWCFNEKVLHWGLEDLWDHLQVRGERTVALFEPVLHPTPHPPSGSVDAVALLGQFASRLASTSLLLSNSQSAEQGDFAGQLCLKDGPMLRIWVGPQGYGYSKVKKKWKQRFFSFPSPPSILLHSLQLGKCCVLIIGTDSKITGHDVDDQSPSGKF